MWLGELAASNEAVIGMYYPHISEDFKQGGPLPNDNDDTQGPQGVRLLPSNGAVFVVAQLPWVGTKNASQRPDRGAKDAGAL